MHNAVIYNCNLQVLLPENVSRICILLKAADSRTEFDVEPELVEVRVSEFLRFFDQDLLRSRTFLFLISTQFKLQKPSPDFLPRFAAHKP